MTTGNTHTYSDAEWRARVDLAAAYRLTDHFGMTSLIYNHITARVPGTDDQFLINEYGLGYDEVAASNLVKLDMDGTSWKRASTGSTTPATSSTPRSMPHDTT